MKIKYLLVENFRSFYGEQIINFSTHPEKNTTIVFAPNGVGKTNLLNAVSWCFHRKFTPSFKGQGDLLNWEAKKRGRKSFHVEVGFEEAGVEWRIRRTGGSLSGFKLWKVVGGNYEEQSTGQEAFINTVLPHDMAGYFISDGEGSDLQIESSAL